MAMPKPQKRECTIEDIYNLPEGARAELVDGQIYYMAPPNTRHQDLVMNISGLIHQYIKSKKGECKVFPAPFAIFLNENDAKYLEPDISVICDKDKLDNDGCHGSPDWIIEIISPSSKRMDYYIKLFKYRTAGVREYWIVDHNRNCITVYNFESEDIQYYTFSDSVRAGIYDDLTIDFSQFDI